MTTTPPGRGSTSLPLPPLSTTAPYRSNESPDSRIGFCLLLLLDCTLEMGNCWDLLISEDSEDEKDNIKTHDGCPFLHAWFPGDNFAKLANLEGHKKGVSGIALPSGSTKLFSGSNDGTVQIWDCHTGRCVRAINLGGEVGCFTCKVPWVFVGMPNTVKAWNIQNGASYDLSGPGQVLTMEVANNILFAGVQDGAVLVWKGGTEADPFQMAAPLKGHTWGVVSLTVERDRLYSGSIDQTIRAWDLHTLECV